MSAKVLGNTAVDMGSNNNEFWYWISKAEPPYLFHCSYTDFAQGRAAMPFPFQPDWIMEAMGIAEFDPAKPYEIIPRPREGGMDLVEKSLSPQGQPVRKVTRLVRTRNQWQVTAHLLQDGNGKEICSAYVSEVQQDHASGVILPRQVQLVWPAEQIRMKMRFDRVSVNPATLTSEQITRLFTRPNMKDVQTYDLARGPEAANGLRPAGGLR
jgi:hypothetical protein